MKRKLALVILACLALLCTVFAGCQTSVHTHELEKVDAKAATCETAGNKEYYRCTGCDKLFLDEAYTAETTLEETVVAALGHQLEHHDAQAPSCTQDGWDAYDICTREGCNHSTYVAIPATHTPAEAVKEKAVAATCEKAGSYDLVVYCSICKHEISRESKTVDALGHDTVSHDAKKATCTEKGWEAYETCSRCDYTTYKEVPALKHDYKETVIDPTYTEQGYTLHKCAKCGDEYKDTYTDVLVHTCQSKCSVCGGCLNEDCNFDVCTSNPCSCVTVRQEAELVASNRDGLTASGNAPANRADDNASNGIFLRAINESSIERPGYYYFKWVIKVDKTCKVKVSIGIGAPKDITDVAAAFPAKLNGSKVEFEGPIVTSGWTNFTSQALGTITLNEGDNVLYIYIGEGAQCNLDYFEFSSPETLTFNETNVYDNVYKKEAEDADYYRGVLDDDSRIRKNANSNASGGYVLGGLGEVSSKAPGKYYLKWSIQSKEACTVTVSVNIAANSVSKKSFSAKLNGESVTLGNTLLNTSWTTYTTQTMGIVDLVEGNNELYIYFSAAALCNIDYFEFSSNSALTFDNQRTNSYKIEAEDSAFNTDVLSTGDKIRVNSSDTASGGKYLGGIGEVSSNAAGVYYIKWTITAAENCTVQVSINLAAYSLSANCFTGNLNSDKLYLNGSELSQLGWATYSTQSMGTVDLNEGENEFYVYFTNKALCNIDYFVFDSDAELSFS